MADNVVDVVIRAKDDTGGGVSSAKSNVSALEGLFGDAGATLGSLAGLAGTAFAAIGAGAIAAGVGAFALGDEFHSAYNTIRVDTGATGDDLETLKGDFKNVVQDVPTDFGSASDAVSKLNVQLGLQGPQLDSLSEQFLNLARITGSDVNQTLTDGIQVFKNWNVAAGDQSRELDTLFEATQASGMSFDQLANELSTNGVKLREMGLSLDGATGFMTSLYKAGIDVNQVMPGLTKEFQSAAKEGKSAGDVLEQTFNAIKNAPNETVAASEAMKVFGARAGPQLAEAIREGKISLEALKGQIQDFGGDTINQASQDTLGFGDRIKMLANTLQVDLEPAATTVFNDVMIGLDKLRPALTTATDAVKTFIGGWTGQGAEVGNELGDWKDKIANFGNQARTTFDEIKDKINEIAATPAWNSFKSVMETTLNWISANGPTILEGLKSAFDDVKHTLQPLIDYMEAHPEAFTKLAQAAGLVAAALVILAAAAATALPAVAALMASMSALAAVIVGTLLAALSQLAGIIVNVFNTVKGAVGSAVGAVVGFVTSLPGIISGAFSTVLSFFAQLPGRILGALAALPGLLGNLFGTAFDHVTFMIGFAAGTIVKLVAGMVMGIVGAATALPGILAGIFSSAWNAATSIVSSLVNDVVGFFTSLPGRAAAAISGLWGALTGSFEGAKTGATSSTTSLVDTVVGFLTSLPGRAAGALAGFAGAVASGLSSAISTAASIGSQIVQGVANGISGGVGFVIDAAKRAAGNIISGFKSALGIGSPSKVAETEVGSWLPPGIAQGIVGGMPRVQRSINDALGALSFQGAVPQLPTVGSYPAAPASFGTPMGGGFAAQVTFAGDIDSGGARWIMNMIRQGRIQISASAIVP